MMKHVFTAILLLLAGAVKSQSLLENLFMGLPMKGNCRQMVDAAIEHTQISIADEPGEIKMGDGTVVLPTYAGFFDGHPMLKKSGKGNGIQIGCLEDGAWVTTLSIHYADASAMQQELKMLLDQLGNALSNTHQIQQQGNSILFYHLSEHTEEGLVVAWGSSESGQGMITFIYRSSEVAQSSR